jgi:hypothetical protein
MTAETVQPTRDDEIRATVARLARPHPAGNVIERAAILAEGQDSPAIVAWIIAHAGQPESAVAPAGHGLHGARHDAARAPLRYVLPAGALAS